LYWAALTAVACRVSVELLGYVGDSSIIHEGVKALSGGGSVISWGLCLLPEHSQQVIGMIPPC